MIEAFTKYSGMDITLEGTGDIEVDAHHLVEDVGLVLGGTMSDALGDRDGIRRFGEAHAPLDKSLVRCVVDYGRRPHVVYAMDSCRSHQRFRRGGPRRIRQGIRADGRRDDPRRLHSRRQPHHIAEAAFKALGLANAEAFRSSVEACPSTKGTL